MNVPFGESSEVVAGSGAPTSKRQRTTQNQGRPDFCYDLTLGKPRDCHEGHEGEA